MFPFETIVLVLITLLLTALLTHWLILKHETIVRFLIGIIVRTLYKINAVNAEFLPESGGVLITPNHMSFVDGLLLQYSVPNRKIRFVVYRDFFNTPIVGWLLRMTRCIPIDEKKSRDAIIQVSDALKKGDAVCIFPEGFLTRTGLLHPFKRGVELILKRSPENTIVIPLFFDKLWGSIFSFKGRKFFWKFPERIPYPVTVFFGKPLSKEISAYVLRQKVSQLGSLAFAMRKKEYKTLPLHFILTVKRFPFKKSIVDPSNSPVTYLKLLTLAILLAEKIKKKCEKEKMIGLMLPASINGVIANIAVSFSGKTAVNLNYRAEKNYLAKCMEKSEIRTVLTSQDICGKTDFESASQMLFTEEIIEEFSAFKKVFTMMSILLLPAIVLKWLYYQTTASPDDLAVVIFLEDPDNIPKGVMLSHSNVIANGEMISQVMEVNSKDRMLGSLPFFDSYGYILTFWLPLLKGIYTAYYPDPMDAKITGEMAETYQITIVFGVPAFYRQYVMGCTPEQFQRLRIAITSTKRLSGDFKEDFERKFGIRLLEGYGNPEMSSVISCNVPDYSSEEFIQKGTKTGSVGMPLPGISAKIVDPENLDIELPARSKGLLLVSGPNRMIGYVKDEKRTSEVLHHEWYITGNIAMIDDDGFIYLGG